MFYWAIIWAETLFRIPEILKELEIKTKAMTGS